MIFSYNRFQSWKLIALSASSRSCCPTTMSDYVQTVGAIATNSARMAEPPSISLNAPQYQEKQGQTLWWWSMAQDLLWELLNTSPPSLYMGCIYFLQQPRSYMFFEQSKRENIHFPCILQTLSILLTSDILFNLAWRASNSSHTQRNIQQSNGVISLCINIAC